MQQSPERPPEERIRLNFMLADAAEVHAGKLFVMGGCVNTRSANAAGLMAIAGTVTVPWNDANRQHSITITLTTEAGEPVRVQTQLGEQPFVIHGNFEMGRPPGIPRGMSLLMPFAAQIALPGLPPGLYHFRFAINDDDVPGAALTLWSADTA